nr:hybrid sensor histidine kinase/response regulator [Niabella hibiscisoli]
MIINPAKELLQHPDAATAKQYAGYILQNSERLLQLINQLLDLSRIENGQMDIRYRNIDMVKWLRMHVQQFGSLAEHNYIKLKFASDMDQLWVEADMDKLEKIVQNLVSNALKFIHTNGAVVVSLHKKDEQLLIKVKDNGIGISKEKQPYIFDRFYQADASDTRTREGAGIGLALVKELTTLLGGAIEVESAEDIGTTFTVILPYQPAKENAEAITPAAGDKEQSYLVTEPAAPMAEHEGDHKETILIAEDNEQLRQFIELSLSDSYQVLTAKDGVEGIAIALEMIPTLAITDLMMPAKNGYELCDTLKKMNVPAIYRLLC